MTPRFNQFVKVLLQEQEERLTPLIPQGEGYIVIRDPKDRQMTSVHGFEAYPNSDGNLYVSELESDDTNYAFAELHILVYEKELVAYFVKGRPFRRNPDGSYELEPSTVKIVRKLNPTDFTMIDHEVGEGPTPEEWAVLDSELPPKWDDLGKGKGKP